MKANSLKALACGALVAGPATAEAVVTSYYLEFDGIQGSATSKDYKGAIAIDDFSWGISVVAAQGVGGGTAGKPIVSAGDFSWTQALDISTPKIFASLGKPIKSAELHGVSDFEFFTMKFSEVLITSFKITGSSGDETTVSGSFQYKLLEMIVTPRKTDGKAGTPVSGKFDITGFKGATEVFSQIANFDEPIPAASSVVPVPAALPLLVSGFGCLALAGVRRRRALAA